MTLNEQPIAALPGGISLSHLRVYKTAGPDGLRGEVRTCISHVVKRIS